MGIFAKEKKLRENIVYNILIRLRIDIFMSTVNTHTVVLRIHEIAVNLTIFTNFYIYAFFHDPTTGQKR